MENWQHQLDEILWNPPCDETEEIIECGCGEIVREGEEYYVLDGEIWCPKCIDDYVNDFLDDHKKVVGA